MGSCRYFTVRGKMINQEYNVKRHNITATVIGNHESLTLTYSDCFLGEISHTFSPANGKYLTYLHCAESNDKNHIVKVIKESILHAEG